MSETKGDKKTAATAPVTTHAEGQESSIAGALPDLMAAGETMAGKSGATVGKPTKGPDLEAEALRAAEAALADGQAALAAARPHLTEAPPPPPRGRGREIALACLLGVNVLAMIIVALLPPPEASGKNVVEAPESVATEPHESPAAEVRFNEPWNRALAAAERRDFKTAVAILDAYLTPRMAPSQQLSVLMALSHYSARNNDFKAAQEYQRRADAIEHSHSLPDDLVAMAKAAADSGDQESLRRIWARFLLQQRQIPPWLFKHVAEAYLQLGDSYRQQANAAEEQARLEQMAEAAARLREAQAGTEGGGK